MSARAPLHALRLMPLIAAQVAKHGLRKGLANATAKANPTLMVIEAATSVAGAIASYLQYRTAIACRDGLKKLLPLEDKRLRDEREKLRQQLDRVRADMDQRQKIQERLGQLVNACVNAVRLIWEELEMLRYEDLPDLDIIEQLTEQLDGAWHQFQAALAYYQEMSN